MKKTILSLIVSAGCANAAVIQTYSINGSDTVAGDQTAFDGNISMTDLINASQVTLGSAVASDAASAGFSATGANDGVAGSASTAAYWNNGSSSVTLTYTLVGSATGYDITSISTIYGWSLGADEFTNQEYDIEFATVATPTFTLFGSKATAVGFTTNVEASSQNVWTENSTGILQSGVTGIRFTIRSGGGSGQIGVIREIDVFGVASIPEPSSTALLGLGGLALILRRRR